MAFSEYQIHPIHDPVRGLEETKQEYKNRRLRSHRIIELRTNKNGNGNEDSQLKMLEETFKAAGR